jgi:hypothetical protein
MPAKWAAVVAIEANTECLVRAVLVKGILLDAAQAQKSGLS